MVRAFLLVGLALAILVPHPVLAGHFTQDNSPEDVAQAFLDDLIAGEFEAASAWFDDQMNSALPAETLAQVWAQLTAQVGAFQEQTGVRSQRVENLTVVIITLQFEKAALDAQISVNADGQISGLYFVPAATTLAAAWEPPAYADPDTFTEQEVLVGVGTKWELPGTLTLPNGDGPFPAVVLVHGSGPHDRDETIGPNKVFRDLAWGLASNGIAVLRYDKRTLIYGSEIAADPAFTVQEETVEDALAAVNLLRRTEGIDPVRVFVLGHSQGAYLAPQIGAADPVLAGLILLAAPARPLEDLVLEQTKYLLALDGELSDEDQNVLAETAAQVEAVKTVTEETAAEVLLFHAPPAYWLSLKGYDPVATANTLTMPLLILQGERDYQVTMTDFALWQAGLTGNAILISYPDLNHLFMSGEGPGTPSEYDTPGHVAEAVITDIVNWILQVESSANAQ